VELATVLNLVIAVAERGAHTRQQGGKPHLALDNRARTEVFTVEVEQIE
jgi:hypothetical protein